RERERVRERERENGHRRSLTELRRRRSSLWSLSSSTTNGSGTLTSPSRSQAPSQRHLKTNFFLCTVDISQKAPSNTGSGIYVRRRSSSATKGEGIKFTSAAPQFPASIPQASILTKKNPSETGSGICGRERERAETEQRHRICKPSILPQPPPILPERALTQHFCPPS
ncbi:hypothetical protein PIB30_096399, partial [Stylosanthes scabra]|nr:hypothetical protein [Stylosanthes scabra]